MNFNCNCNLPSTDALKPEEEFEKSNEWYFNPFGFGKVKLEEEKELETEIDPNWKGEVWSSELDGVWDAGKLVYGNDDKPIGIVGKDGSIEFYGSVTLEEDLEDLPDYMTNLFDAAGTDGFKDALIAELRRLLEMAHETGFALAEKLIETLDSLAIATEQKAELEKAIDTLVWDLVDTVSEREAAVKFSQRLAENYNRLVVRNGQLVDELRVANDSRAILFEDVDRRLETIRSLNADKAELEKQMEVTSYYWNQSQNQNTYLIAERDNLLGTLQERDESIERLEEENDATVDLLLAYIDRNQELLKENAELKRKNENLELDLRGLSQPYTGQRS